MYQVEVKRCLIQLQFAPSDGWAVTVDLDPMERGKGKQNVDEKRAVADGCLRRLSGCKTPESPMINKRPNMRVQRTRSSASPPHSPLTRRPLGSHGPCTSAAQPRARSEELRRTGEMIPVS